MPPSSLRVSVEIHFHEQEKASVFIESNCSDEMLKFGEIGLFSSFCIRQFSNLGVHAVTDQTATMLTTVPEVIQHLASGQVTGGFELVPYPGYKGRKVFEGQFDFTGSGPRFDMKARGFGWFSRGMGYYAPVSLVVILRYLAQKRRADMVYLMSLGYAAVLCGEFHLSRRITLLNHPNLVSMILAESCGSFVDKIED
jgi:hypothetical protein